MPSKRITLDLDEPLLARLDQFAEEGSTSRNQLIVGAIQTQLKQLERERLDREFEEMGRDEAYQQLMLDIDRELAPVSAEMERELQAQELQDLREDAA